jgi:hypothetical protein
MKTEGRLSPGDKAGVTFALFSLDPGRDTPAVMRQFAAEHGLDRSRWRLFAANDEGVRDLAAVLGVKYKREASGDIAHSAMIFVIDRQGVVRHRQVGLSKNPRDLVAALARARLTPARRSQPRSRRLCRRRHFGQFGVDLHLQANGSREGTGNQTGLIRPGHDAPRLGVARTVGDPESRADHETGERHVAVKAVQRSDGVAGQRHPRQPRRTRHATKRQHETVDHGPDERFRIIAAGSIELRRHHRFRGGALPSEDHARHSRPRRPNTCGTDASARPDRFRSKRRARIQDQYAGGRSLAALGTRGISRDGPNYSDGSGVRLHGGSRTATASALLH